MEKRERNLSGSGDWKHILQQTRHDCGITCLQMLFMEYEKSDDYDYNSFVVDDPTAIWTIDLVMALVRMGLPNRLLKFKYYTITDGICENHKNLSYYEDKISNEEEDRIQRHFKTAHSLDIIEIVHFTTLQLQSFFNDHHHASDSNSSNEGIVTAALVLVDSNAYEYDYDQLNQFYHPRIYCEEETKETEKSYQGHFILVVGCDETRKEFAILDPSAWKDFKNVTKQLLYVTVDDLDYVRLKPGTDLDVITFQFTQAE